MHYCDFNIHDHQRSEATNGRQPTMGSRLERLNDFKLGRSGISLFDLNFVITWTRQVNSYFSAPCSSIKVLPVCGKKKMYETSPHGPREAVPRSMDIDRDRMTVEFASKVADLGNWDSMERILFSHKTMTMISNQNLYETRNPYDVDYLHKK